MLYTKILENFVLPLGDLLTGSTVMKRFRYWKQITSLSENEISEHAEDKLKKVLNFAVNKIPFYKQNKPLMKENPYEWIKGFPIITKSIIKENIDDLLSKPKSKLIYSSTSGSSGEHGIVYKEKKDISNGQALILLIWGWAGYEIGAPILQTGMTTNRGFIKTLKDFFFRTKYYIAFGLSDSEIENLLIRQQHKKDYYLAGYASSLFVLANVCLKKNISNVHFKKAISLGDKMFPHYRTKIKEAFGCEVSDTYGLSEELTIAAQKDNEYYYILTPHVFVEILDENGNDVADGELGRVIATSLDAYGMPLIRYDTGDLAIRLPKERYPQKRDLQLPLMEKIIGRDTDIVKTPSGKYMIVHFFTGIFEFIPQIKQFKVIQRELTSIEIEYIPNIDFSRTILNNVEKQIHEYLNEPFPVFWKEVEEILPTPSGKPQIIQSFIIK